MKERYQKLIDAANKAMLEKLHENNHKRGWHNFPLENSCIDLRIEYRELYKLIHPSDPLHQEKDYQEIRREAADIANYAAMIILKCDNIIKGLNNA